MDNAGAEDGALHFMIGSRWTPELKFEFSSFPLHLFRRPVARIFFDRKSFHRHVKRPFAYFVGSSARKSEASPN